MRSNVLVLMAAAAVSVGAQDIVSARAGLIHHMEGAILINGEAVQQNGDTFLSMKQGETLSTERGRAEVLLNAGTYLRIGEASSFRLDSADLESTKLTLLSGTVLVEVAELPKDTSATLEILGSQVALKKRGLYEFTADKPGNVRVYDGEIALTAEGATAIKVSKGREIAFNALRAGPGKFDEKETSELYNWGSRRAIYIAQANESAARSAYSAGTTGSVMASMYGFGLGAYQGIWVFNPFYGMYTYLPFRGFGYSPYGFRLLSPATAYQPVIQTSSFTGNSGFSQGTDRSAVSSPAYSNSAAAVSSSAGAVATPAVSAPAVESPNTGGGGDAGRRR
jgi:hypothetical protein